MTESLPTTAVLRVSTGSFEPSRYAEVDALATRQADYLVPAITRLPGLLRWYAAVSPDGSIVNVSTWDTDEHAAQMGHLKEMTVIARGEMEALDVVFKPIVNYPIIWNI
ncbi:hypothetical protein KDL01_19335 [Actinospica durhamensis]|uniref:ABM domain-containing protein n=1 Tax=Actinospica durhamensis TaxID=1508375 RepID=A0A941IRL5_9ACTN|nr:hypothetical protein [Actinospica durhamensis]MBR7835437.1 hypothetical protein [Actinospica durhamensis]